MSEADALKHVFGYASGNDFSARDLQRKTSQFMLGKTCDGFAPLGPWIVGAGLVPDPQKLDLWCEVNGERRQSSNTADMVFNCAQIVSYVSQHMTLMPGDIIFTGTPEGVIAGQAGGQARVAQARRQAALRGRAAGRAGVQVGLSALQARPWQCTRTASFRCCAPSRLMTP